MSDTSERDADESLAPTLPARKPWSTPRVILSEFKDTEKLLSVIEVSSHLGPS